MRTHQYQRKNQLNGAKYHFFELSNAVRVVRKLGNEEFEHIFSKGDFVQGRTLKKFDFDMAIANGHAVYVTSEEFPPSNAQSLAAQIDFIYRNSTEEKSSLEADLNEIVSNPSIGATEKESLIKSRIGQGVFRQQQFNMWGGCAVTGCEVKELLVASHIIPWSVSESHRLNPYNGFLLVAHLDKAFDSGLISFDPAGNIMISSKFKGCGLIGIHPAMNIKLKPEHEEFLEYHRLNVYINV
ncbi:HNH endonuclease [Vibrio sp. Vb2424]|uniref:HNH endonuclease n=1 Tax=Vibrio sp. Vb2424 TaxID=2816074 RepID=UPI001A90486D|nr:HNH endonuclease [Vibrio sp. Vb2424]MBO0146453.1 HNH endonuclease [Vibrio sp. Vb2424]HCE1967468.1 HNH endonuclease [Vibrio parahaemolyticus]HCE1970870.1 HNH endonuclease [Vibrio parahaemolyticus]